MHAIQSLMISAMLVIEGGFFLANGVSIYVHESFSIVGKISHGQIPRNMYFLSNYL